MAIPMFLSLKSTTTLHCSMNFKTTMPIYSGWNLIKTLFLGEGVMICPQFGNLCKRHTPPPSETLLKWNNLVKTFFFSIMWTTVILVKSINNLISWANHYCCNNTFIVTHKPGFGYFDQYDSFPHWNNTIYCFYQFIIRMCWMSFLMALSGFDHACRPLHPIGILTFTGKCL